MVSLEKFHRIENPRSKHINVFKLLIKNIIGKLFSYESLKDQKLSTVPQEVVIWGIKCVDGGEEWFAVFWIGKM